MQKPKIGQRVVWKSPRPEERSRGTVTAINEKWTLPVQIRFDYFSPQENDPREILGRTIGQEMYFSLYEYDRYFDQEEEGEN